MSRPLTMRELSDLRVMHSRATHPSQRIRKGWEIRDETEPNGRRLLTDGEIEEITRPAAITVYAVGRDGKAVKQDTT